MKINKLIKFATCCLSGLLLFNSCDTSDDGFNPVSIDTYEDEIVNFREIAPNFDENDIFTAVFEPYAGNAVSYEIFFGDEENEQPLILPAGESVVHTFPGIGCYDVVYNAVSASGKTGSATATLSIGVPETLEYGFDEPVAFAFADNQSTYEIVENPFLTGVNTDTTKVGKFNKAALTFQGFGYNKDTEDGEGKEVLIDFTVPGKLVTLKVYSTIAARVQLIFQQGANGVRAVEAVAEHEGNGWELLEFDYNEGIKAFIPNDPENGQSFVPVGMYREFVILINGPSADPGTFYFDDMIQLGGCS